SNDALSSIVWRAKYGAHLVDFIDDGTFAPATRVDNYLLFEVGKTRFNWWGAVGDALGLMARPIPQTPYPLTITNVVLTPYISSEDPENCSIVRVTSAAGDTWLNPALA